MVVAVAGHVEHADVVRQVRKAFSRSGFLTDVTTRPAPSRRAARFRKVSAGEAHVERPFEQVNLVLGVNGLARADERRYALGVLNAAVGGGPSSRLFQEVRERRGLAYSVYSFAQHYTDAGAFCVGAGCLPGKLDDVLKVVREELSIVARDGITSEELARGKGQLRGGLVLGLEDSASRMSRIAKAELLYDELPSIDEIIRRVDAVTLDDVHSLARTLFRQPETLAVVGPAV
jgi:predicted Zn-dependent peptidase